MNVDIWHLSPASSCFSGTLESFGNFSTWSLTLSPKFVADLPQIAFELWALRRPNRGKFQGFIYSVMGFDGISWCFIGIKRKNMCVISYNYQEWLVALPYPKKIGNLNQSFQVCLNTTLSKTCWNHKLVWTNHILRIESYFTKYGLVAFQRDVRICLMSWAWHMC